MINLLLLLFFLGCLGIVGAWVAENPGSVIIHWFDYRIDTSFAFILLTAMAASILLVMTALLIRRLITAPRHYAQARTIRHHKQGLAELTYSVAALAATDIAGAEAHTRKAEKLLGRTPLVLLLSAQIARSQGDDARTRLLLEQMLSHEETEYLAARSLSEAASKQQLFPQALELAERAQRVNPREKSSSASIVGLHVRLKQWQEALHAINTAMRKGRLSRNEARHYKCVVYLQQGEQQLAARQVDSAVIAAKHALKERPGYVPTLLFAARAYVAADQRAKAMKLLLNAQKQAPHPQLNEALRGLIAHEPKEKQEKLLRKLPAQAGGVSSETAWVCQSCGHASVRWDAHCAGCSAFDSMEWKQRELKFVA